MAIFYRGEKNPTDAIVEADVFQIVRMGGTAPEIIQSIKDHFKGNATEAQIQKAFKNLMEK
ncbi:MAG: hypothetical protein DRH26_00555 [Deltaproteobacteria bacterium]|nr:MAG: hypothetical protein DRH26_00555 [Deltaproteobacteria bacterium]